MYAELVLKSAVPNEEDGLTKLFRKYGYNSTDAMGTKLTQIQEFQVPLGANIPGEEIIMKALGLERMDKSNNNNTHTNSTSEE